MTKSEKITQFAVVIIAVGAVAVSVWQGQLSRQHLDLAQENIRISQEHNKLSVRPYLDFFSGWVEENEWRLLLMNEGVGPAIIKAVELTFDGKTYSHWDALLDGADIRDLRINSTNLGKDSPFKTDKEVIFVTLRRNSSNPKPMGISILIKYTSIYDEPFEISTNF